MSKKNKYKNYVKELTKSATSNILGQHVVSRVSAATGIPVPSGVSASFGLLGTRDFVKTSKKVLAEL